MPSSASTLTPAARRERTTPGGLAVPPGAMTLVSEHAADRLPRTTDPRIVAERGLHRSQAQVERLELAIAGAAVVNREAPAVALMSPTAARIGSALAMGPRSFADLVQAVRAEGSDDPIGDLRRALEAARVHIDLPELRAAQVDLELLHLLDSGTVCEVGW